MPRDSQGNYALPPGYRAVAGQKIQPSQHNPPLEDLAEATTGSLPRNGSAPMLGNLPMGGRRISGMGAGTAGTDAATVDQANAAGPIGAIVAFAGDNAPQGWLFCAGGAYSRTTYAALFAVIGTKYGAGDGSTTFQVPDIKGCVIAGRDNMGGTDAQRLSTLFGSAARTLGSIFGTARHLLTEGEMPGHTHSGSTSVEGSHSHTFPTSGVGGSGPVRPTQDSNQDAGLVTTNGAGAHAHTFTTGIAGGTQPHPNVQPTFIANYIIRAF